MRCSESGANRNRTLRNFHQIGYMNYQRKAGQGRLPRGGDETIGRMWAVAAKKLETGMAGNAGGAPDVFKAIE